MTVRISIKTSPQRVDWPTLEAVWARIGESDAFDGVWLNDHLTDLSGERWGPSFEAFTVAAALAHHVKGRWIGHGVLANTFRHPALLAKAATVLDHATAGHFVLGLGAGWHEGEHAQFGIPLPPMPERFDRFESAVEVLKALFSPAAAAPPGVTRPDPYYPLDRATNEPPPYTPGGPPLYLGGQRRRGIALAARLADGWLLPGIAAGDVPYFIDRRDALQAACEAIGRDPATLALVGQVACGTTAAERRAAVEGGVAFVRAGASEIVLAMVPAEGPAGVEAIERDVARPLREAIG